MEQDAQNADRASARTRPLCREPWQRDYILRRGVLPCCYGDPIAPMSEWATAWNSPQLQEIRSYLAKGQLSPYCLLRLSCPIVQRHLEERPKEPVVPAKPADAPAAKPPKHALVLRIANRALGGLPGRFYWWMRGEGTR